MKLIVARFGILIGLAFLDSAAVSIAVEVENPKPHQVAQRGFPVPLRLRGIEKLDGYQWRVIALPGAYGTSADWADVPAAGLLIPPGGWYRLEVRRGGDVSTVEPLGVGEVFLIAGQSYAENCNDELLKSQETHGRVVALDLKKGTWGVAADPQPNISSGYVGGTIWPPFGDELAAKLKVPVGFVNVARAATSSSAWLPPGQLHQNLTKAGLVLGRFRAVLWQQGESDVIGNVTADQYVANLKTIRNAAIKEWGFEPLWLPAKSTIHPTVYKKPKEEAVIRQAVDTLWTIPGFRPGPDTDTLTGAHRGDRGSRQHFSPKGQRAAAALWVEAVGAAILEARDK